MKDSKTYFITICWGILLLIAPLSTTHAQNSGPQISYKIEQDSIAIGDYVYLKYKIQNIPNNAVLQLPQYDALLKDGLEFLKDGKTYSLNQTVAFSSYDEGTYTIPPLPFYISTEEGDFLFSTDSALLTVSTVAVDTTQPVKDIYGIEPVEKTGLQNVIIIIVLAVLLIGIIIWRKKIKALLWGHKNSNQQYKGSYISLSEKYLNNLQALQHQNYIQQNEFKIYYSELAVILKNYIEERFGLQAMELTTNELLKQAKRMPTLKRYRSEIRAILERADRVKFAKAKETAIIANDDWEWVKTFIIKTKQIEHTYNV